MFFFEKKNQKTFAPRWRPARRGAQEAKVFASFFKKKRLPSYPFQLRRAPTPGMPIRRGTPCSLGVEPRLAHATRHPG
jgi:hypothetical protein